MPGWRLWNRRSDALEGRPIEKDPEQGDVMAKSRRYDRDRELGRGKIYQVFAVQP